MLKAFRRGLPYALFPSLVLAAAAQEPRPPQPRPALLALDLNHDGSLQPNEIGAATQSLLTLDRNHDGQLTADEYLPADRQRERQTQSDLKARLMTLDRNGDGVLTADELPERMQPLFQRGDTNHDGKLTPEEIDAMARAQSGAQGRPVGRNGAEGPARMDAILNAIDIDHDGVLSAAELASAPGALKSLDKNADGTLQPDEMPMRQQTPGERAAHVLDEWDTNKDGTLTRSECPERMQANFDAIDLNHDGKVDREELTTYFATMPQPGRGPATSPAAAGNAARP